MCCSFIIARVLVIARSIAFDDYVFYTDVQTGSYLSIFIVLFQLTEITLTLNTAYFDDELGVVRERKSIFRRYASSWLIPDLFWLFPWHLMFLEQNSDERLSETYTILQLLLTFQVLRLIH